MRPFREHEEAFAGVGVTFCRVPLVLEPTGLQGADIAIVGAPFDLGASFRPGTRFAPRAIRSAEDVGVSSDRPHIDLRIDPFDVLTVVDYGDIETGPDLDVCHARLEQAVNEVLAAEAIPAILGGDHSLSLPVIRALSTRFGPDGFSVIHFDTHADTDFYIPGVTYPHAAPFYRAIHEGSLRGENLVQIGLRGSWPSPAVFTWMRQQGITWHTMEQVEDRGLAAIVQQVIAIAAQRPRTYLTVDIDVLDPAFAPGTGTPEPGGLTTRELLRAVRRIASDVELCAMDIVEVSPPYDPSGITALAAHRIILEGLSGVALRKRGGHVDLTRDGRTENENTTRI